MSRTLRKLCRFKQFHWLNRRLHRAVLMGASALSEMEESQLAEQFAIATLLPSRTPSIVLDVGCGIGLFARRVRERFPLAEVHAFEPNTDVDLPEGGDVQYHRLALGAAVKRATLYKSPAARAGASLSRDVALVFSGEEPVGEEVDCTTIDAFRAEQSIERIDLVKITAAGLEWDVLFGAVDAITDKRIGAAIFRFGRKQAMTGSSMLHFFDLLERFTLYRMTPGKLARMEAYDFLSSEVYTDQYVMAVAKGDPRWAALWEVSRR